MWRSCRRCWRLVDVNVWSGDGQRIAFGSAIVQMAPVEHLIHGRGHFAVVFIVHLHTHRLSERRKTLYKWIYMSKEAMKCVICMCDLETLIKNVIILWCELRSNDRTSIYNVFQAKGLRNPKICNQRNRNALVCWYHRELTKIFNISNKPPLPNLAYMCSSSVPSMTDRAVLFHFRVNKNFRN